MGVWSANGDLGNIVGFTMTGLMVDQFNLRWEYAMIAAASFNFLMILLIVLFVREKQKERQNPLSERILSEENTSDTLS